MRVCHANIVFTHTRRRRRRRRADRQGPTPVTSSRKRVECASAEKCLNERLRRFSLRVGRGRVRVCLRHRTNIYLYIAWRAARKDRNVTKHVRRRHRQLLNPTARTEKHDAINSVNATAAPPPDSNYRRRLRKKKNPIHISFFFFYYVWIFFPRRTDFMVIPRVFQSTCRPFSTKSIINTDGKITGRNTNYHTRYYVVIYCIIIR